jgi:hypothetical protein
MAWTVAQFALVFGVLPVLVVVLTRLDRRATGRGAHRWWSRHAVRTAAPKPVGRPIQVVAADLRRLSRQLALVPVGAPLVRWKALWSAYDAVLAEAAEQLEVSHELGATCLGTPRDIERLRVLAALESAGLAVRG